MYDPMGDLFPQYGVTVYGTSDGYPQDPPYDRPDRGDDPPVAGTPWPPYPTVETLGSWEQEGAFVLPPPWAPTAEPAAVELDAAPPPLPRRRRPGRPVTPWSQFLGPAVGGLTAVTVGIVCLLDCVLSYGPLQDLAFSRVPHGLSRLWPIAVYGPWLAGCLSALRAAVEGRRPRDSWTVLILSTSAVAGLCVATVPWTVLNIVVVGLPPITAMISLHQLVRQLDTVGRAGGPRCAAHRRTLARLRHPRSGSGTDRLRH
ncbi:hypothetical protein ACIGXM_22215 [Kitasatospora sp. NPDC052896]|uniref:hypothetical protein n=1 Tax=Kitasatospora sp. NPDC052896 TaxID=3364061 RepID=UPI0037C9AA29